MERRLAAILAADMVGYSRLMAADEAGTIDRQKAHRTALIDPKIAQYGGRIVKTTGDGLLAEFPSVIDAVQCAVEIQYAMPQREAEVPADQRVRYRIGINLGDIVTDGDDILGDGVNIAARLEGLAEPDGICISRPVHTQIKGKLDLTFAHLGAQEVKNIPEPVTVYRVVLDDKAAALATPVVHAAAAGRRRPWPAIAAAFVLCLLGIGGLLWWQLRSPDVEPASVEAMALPLPEKPSLAVLPFANTSGDPEQEYFADGITDDLTTDLSRLSGVFVISRNSAFAYKGKAIKIREVAEDLGVRYVLEGSVRRVGDQVRINAQLTDALSGGYVWAQRYDRELDNIFAVQDAITASVVQALELQLSAAEQGSAFVKRATGNLEAYDLVLKARKLLTRFDHESAREAKALLERAIELDPGYVEAHSLLGLYYFDEWRLWGRKRDENLARALELAQRASELDPSDPAPHVLLAQVHQFRREFDEASRQADIALALKPHDAVTLANLGSMLRYAHRGEDAVKVVEQAVRLDPFHPPNYLEWLADAYSLVGRYDDCIEAVTRGLALDPDFVALHVNAAQCYGPKGERDKMKEAGANILRIKPNFTLRGYRAYVPFTEPADLETNVDWLRQAGIPE